MLLRRRARTTPTDPRPRGRPRGTALTAAGAVAALAVPAAAAAAASPWPMPAADAGATNQSPNAGPTDPGLKWFVDLEDVEKDFAPEGYSSIDELLVSDSGMLVGVAANEDRQYDNDRFASELIGIDAATGEVAWQVDNVSPISSGGCAPALDSRDRVWIEQRQDGDNMVAAFDTATGEPTGATIEADDRRCREQILLGGDPERMVFSDRDADGLRMFDLSAEEPVEIGVELAERDDIGSLLNSGRYDHWGVLTSDHLVTLVEIVDGDGDEVAHRLQAISLVDGTVTDELDLPTPAGTSSVDYDRAYLLADGDRVYAAPQGEEEDQVLAFDAAGGTLSLDWEHTLDLRADDLTLGDGVVYIQDGRRVAGTAPALTALSTADGSVVFDDGEPFGEQPLANPEGSLYGRTTDGGTRLNEISLVGPDGQLEWRVDRGRLVQEIDTVDEYDDLDFGVRFTMEAIGPDGTLYISGGSSHTILALDDSGGLTTFICGDSFTDVEPSDTHACNIDQMAERGITAGIGGGLFDPDGDVPREQFASFLVNALDDVDPVASGPFTDVDPNSVHAANIFGAAEAGITQGTSATTFAPTRDITRAEVASLLARAFELDPVDDGPFADVDRDNVHAGNINAVFEAGITQGTSDTTFEPERTLSRAQMSSLLIRALDAGQG